MTARRYKIGEGVIWTSYHDGSRHEYTITGYDDTDDLAGNPCYVVRREGEHSDTVVSEVDLSPWQRPQLGIAGQPEPVKPPPVRDTGNSGSDDSA